MQNELIHITFMRHGRSLADDEGKFEGRYDSPLTDVGKEQAKKRATGWLNDGVTFNLVITSSLQRAYESAEIIATILNAPIETDSSWMEMDNGELAGLTFAEGDQSFPKPSFRNPYEPIARTGESEIRLHSRASLAVEQLVLRGPGRYLVVAHGGILNAAFRVIMGAPVPVNYTGAWFALGDTGYAVFSYNFAHHRWMMRELNPNLDS